MTFEEKATDTWYDDKNSTAQDDLKARSSARKTKKVTEAVTKTSPLVKKADLVAKGKDAQLPLFPEEKEEKNVSLTKEDAAKIKDTVESLKPTSDKYQKLVENARKAKGPKSPLEVAEEVKDILEEGKMEEPGSSPEETVTPTPTAAQEGTKEDKPEVVEMKGTFNGVDLSDGLSMSEADNIAKAYEGTSSNVKADMFLNYMRSNLKLSDEQIKKIVDATKTDSALRREFYEGKPTIENVGGVTGSEMRRGKEASDAMKKEFSNAYEAYKKDAEKAGKDVAKSQTYETERNPRSVLSALKNGEFGNIGKDADPAERKQAFQTAIYLGGDIVATALKNIGVSFKGGQPTGESMWAKRQKQKFEAATANANKALDAGTDAEIKGKQQAFDYKQAIEKSIDDGRIQKMFDSLGEDIKADDVLRDIAKYESVANTFQGKSLDQKARIILGMEMDGKQLSTQALVAMLATLTSEEYQQLGGRIAELAKGIGSGIGEAVKGLFGNFFPKGGIDSEDITAGIQKGMTGLTKVFVEATGLDDYMKKKEQEKLKKQIEKAKEKNKDVIPVANEINSYAENAFPGIKVDVINGQIKLKSNIPWETLQEYADKYGIPWKSNPETIAKIKARIAVDLLNGFAEQLPDN